MGFWHKGGFFSSVKGHVIKWWQLVIMPVLRINNNTQVKQNTVEPQVKEDVSEPIQQVMEEKPEVKQQVEKEVEPVSEATGKAHGFSTEDPIEVMNRINREKEEARRKEIEVARKKAQEQARIDAIMNAKKVDVDAFIAAGKAAQQEELHSRQAESEDPEVKRRREEDLRKAQDIVERLNREAMEDEQKKQAEIEQARQQATGQWG